MNEVRITLRHCIQLGYCAPQIRRWMDENGHDYLAFARHGIAVTAVEHTDDFFCRKIVAHARKEHEDGK